ncbi:MAG TPA: NUDIX hydrolase [Candidatus Acidoferrales bacterium]|nr:NUDIX hydrolase [Candidatus Acidoferrales bacterium]
MKREIYKGRVVDLYLESAELPNGVTVNLEIVRHPGASAIVALDDSEAVTLIRQYRYAAGEFIWEIPAGKLDGEEPGVCAARELREEAGLIAREMIHLGSVLTTPGFTDERIHLFLARGLTAVAQELEADEILTVSRVPLPQALQMIQRGEIQDGKSIVALYLASEFLKREK